MLRSIQCLSFALLLLLTSCFEYTEETWINPDGTGRLKIEVSISEALVAMGDMGNGEKEDTEKGSDLEEMGEQFKNIESDIKENESVEEVTLEEFSEAGMRHYVIDIKIKDLAEFARIREEAQIKNESDKTAEISTSDRRFEFEDLGKGKFRYFQHLTMEGPEEPEKTEEDNIFGDGFEEMGKALALSMFADKYYTVILHAPEIVSTNGRLDEETQTVTWRVPLTELMSGSGISQDFEAEIQMPQPKWITFAIIGISGLLVMVMLSAVARKRKVRSSAQREAENNSD